MWEDKAGNEGMDVVRTGWYSACVETVSPEEELGVCVGDWTGDAWREK